MFQPGESGNPNGRKPGTRNRRTEALWGDLEAKGDIDPAVYLSSVVSDPNKPEELRTTAASHLMPYKYGKRGTVNPARFIDEPLQLPLPTTIAQARENIAYISDLKAQGRLDIDTADSLIADNKAAAGILIEEAKLAAQGQGTGEQVIRIEGGMSQLPGTAIIGMESYPQFNGHNGHVIEHANSPAPKPSDNGQVVNPALAQDKPLESLANES